jgi:RNA polymerase sigma factor (sigma-70 family)
MCTTAGNGAVAAAAIPLDNSSFLLLIQQPMDIFSGSDRKLLQAVFAGDVAGWQKFIAAYADPIYRAISKYCDDDDEKMAVFIHIMEKLRENRFARLRGFEGRAKLSTWLTVVARRLAIDFLRARYGRDFRLKKIRVVSYDAVPAVLKQLADNATPERELAATERRRARAKLEAGLHQALTGLSPQESLAIQLVYFKGLKMNEAGRLLRVPSVYKFIDRTLKKIRCRMESEPRFSRTDVTAALVEKSHE